MATTAKKRGLGKGLSALMSDSYSHSTAENTAGQGTGTVVPAASGTLPIASLRSGTFQPRRKFMQEKMEELIASVRRNGVVQPILVRPIGGEKYEIIAGERRWRAAREVGLEDVPAIVRELSDEQALELALVENIQRSDLTPIEEAAGYQRLMEEFEYTQEQLASTVGKSRSHIANLIRLLDLPDVVQDMLENGQLSAGHARALLGVENAIDIAQKVAARGLSVRQTEKLARDTDPGKARRSRAPKAGAAVSAPVQDKAKDPDILALEETLSENLGLKVSINDRGAAGEIVIAYFSLEQLDEILRRLGGSI